MKKSIRLLLCIVCAVLAFVTCSKKGVEPDNPQPTPSEPTPTITIPATENVTPSFSDDGGAATVAFTTNANWSAKVVESGATWCTVSPASGGSGSHTLTINTSKNDTPDSRTATVQLIAGTVTKTINITQKQKDALTVTSAKFNVPAEGGNIDIEAKANVELSYTIEGDAKNWISYVETKALKTSHLIFKVSANENTEAREGKITVSGGGISETITVAQAAKVPAEFKISQTEVEVGSEKSTFEITITSSIGYQVKPEADWIKQTASSGEGGVYTHTFEVAENGSSDAREGIIVVCNDEQVCIPVKVKQAAKNTLLVTQTQYEVPQEGGSIDIEAKANVELTYTIEGEAKNWISHIETKALKTSHLIFKVSANENTEAREGKITVSGGGLSNEITVVQAAKVPAEFKISQTVVEVGAEKNSFEITITSSIGYEVKPEVDWVKQTSVTGSNGVYTHTFEVAENSSADAREGVIVVCNDEQVCIPVRVKQRGASNGSDAWVNKEFYHHSIAMRFTADWCGYCPNMATALAKAQKALPDKLEVLSVHADGGLYSSASATLCNFYGIGGFPTGVVDGRAVVENYDVSTIVSRVSSIVNETEAKYPTITGASWNSAISSNKVSLDLNVYLKKAGSYKVTALLVEDNIVAYQADYTNGSSNDYVHKDVVRAAFSNVLGDAVTIAEDGQIKSFNYSLDIPSGYNKNNLRIVVYVQAQDANGSYYINNASSAAVGKQQQLMVKSDNSGGVEGIVPGEDIPYNN